MIYLIGGGVFGITLAGYIAWGYICSRVFHEFKFKNDEHPISIIPFSISIHFKKD